MFTRLRLMAVPLWLIGAGIALHGLAWLLTSEPWLLDRAANERLLHTSYEALFAAPENHHLRDYLTGVYRFFGWWVLTIGLLVMAWVHGADLRQRRARVALLSVLLVATLGLLFLQLRFIPRSPFLWTTAGLVLGWGLAFAASVTWPRDEREVWDELAGGYDRTIRLFDRSYEQVRARLRTELEGRGKVLEVAAGTGLFTSALLAEGRTVVATDFSPQMVERLRARVAAAGHADISVLQEDATRLSFADAQFDAVVCANALHVMPEPERALAEFHRVLAPGGLLLLPTFGHGASRRARWVSALMSAVSRFRSYSRFDAADLERLVARAGFSDVSTATLSGLLPMLFVRGVATPRAPAHRAMGE